MSQVFPISVVQVRENGAVGFSSGMEVCSGSQLQFLFVEYPPRLQLWDISGLSFSLCISDGNCQRVRTWELWFFSPLLASLSSSLVPCPQALRQLQLPQEWESLVCAETLAWVEEETYIFSIHQRVCSHFPFSKLPLSVPWQHVDCDCDSRG